MTSKTLLEDWLIVIKGKTTASYVALEARDESRAHNVDAAERPFCALHQYCALHSYLTGRPRAGWESQGQGLRHIASGSSPRAVNFCPCYSMKCIPRPYASRKKTCLRSYGSS